MLTNKVLKARCRGGLDRRGQRGRGEIKKQNGQSAGHQEEWPMGIRFSERHHGQISDGSNDSFPDSVRVGQFAKKSRSESFVRSVEFPVAVNRIMECTVLS